MLGNRCYEGHTGVPAPVLGLLSPALTDTPDIHVQGTLASGHPTNFTCVVPWACDRGTPPTFSWTGVALTSPHPESPRSSVLTLTPRPQDHGTNLTCLVNFSGAGVSTEATIRLNVSCKWGAKWLGPRQCRGEGGRAWAAGTGGMEKDTPLHLLSISDVSGRKGLCSYP